MRENGELGLLDLSERENLMRELQKKKKIPMQKRSRVSLGIIIEQFSEVPKTIVLQIQRNNYVSKLKNNC